MSSEDRAVQAPVGLGLRAAGRLLAHSGNMFFDIVPSTGMASAKQRATC